MRNMLSVASLLNPDPPLSELPSPLPSPCSTLYSPSASLRTPLVRKHKLCKDEATFVKGIPQIKVNYWPCELQNEKATAEHSKYQLYPFGRIAEFCKHVPYRSEKKTILNKTGREGFDVFQYTFQMPHEEKRQTVMWDYNNGLVRITPFFKALDYAKTTPARMLGKNPGLKEICLSITGGSLAAQGYWMPFEAAKAVAATFCYRIRYVLTPVFGLDFASQCTPPGAPGFDSMHIDPKIIRKCVEMARDGREARSQPRSESRSETPSSMGATCWTAANKAVNCLQAFDSASGYGTESDSSNDYPYLCSPVKQSRRVFKSLVTAPRSVGFQGKYKEVRERLPCTPTTASGYESDSSNDCRKRKRNPPKKVNNEYDSSSTDSSEESSTPAPLKRMKGSGTPAKTGGNLGQQKEMIEAANILVGMNLDNGAGKLWNPANPDHDFGVGSDRLVSLGGELSQKLCEQSEFKVPTLDSTTNMSNSNGSPAMQNARDTAYNGLNHPMTQNMKNTVSNGPVAENVKNQSAITSSEFRNLADSRTAPNKSTATGQPLTHYHSFFYNLLSWENPRATTISFLSTILFIFAARYLPALRWTFKVLWMTLGVTAAMELGGKLVLSQGLASSFRPKRYYTIPREALESSLEDVEQLINFFVIEFQRVLFAEKPAHTVAAFVASLISYWLIKFTPLWGLSLIAVSLVYLGPLVYISNQEFIDHHLENATNVANSQANQLKDLTAHHTSRATGAVKSYAGDYTSMAQSYIGSARGSTSPKAARSGATAGPGSAPAYTSSDFPHAPKQEPVMGATSHQEQYENSKFGGKAEPAY
ncbi:MAG: hypothetical protein Q9212_004344 [Teloschistes hypoglaucus]